jgi:prophage tail gpP-like protein
MSLKAHSVSVQVNGYTIERWLRYVIRTDMLAPADDFDLEIGPVTQELYELVPPDSAIEVFIDGTKILTGFIDERRRVGGRQGSTLQITGRDRGGRLVDESMPLTSFSGMDLESLANVAIGLWFPEVTFSNAANRDLVRGRRGRKASPNSEPAIVFDRSKAPKKVEPGETRWQTLLNWLEPAKLLGWSTAAGDAFVIGLPNYDQEPQFAFFCPKKSSKRASLGNVLDWEIVESVADRYSEITVTGTCRGDATNYSRNLLKNTGVAQNGTGLHGTGADFEHSKQLILADDAVKSVSDADDRAEREMAVRDASAEVISVTLPGHGQRHKRTSEPTLYAFDTVCTFEDEEISLEGRYLIAAVEFRCGRDEAEVSTLTLVPEGTVLTQ